LRRQPNRRLADKPSDTPRLRQKWRELESSNLLKAERDEHKAGDIELEALEGAKKLLELDAKASREQVSDEIKKQVELLNDEEFDVRREATRVLKRKAGWQAALTKPHLRVSQRRAISDR
jgi:hypothetical protein